MTPKRILLGLFIILSSTLIGASHAGSIQTPIQFYSEHFPPFTIDDHGDIHGEAVDLVRKMMAILEHPDTIQVKPWARAYKHVLRDPNSAVFLMARTPKREKKFKWVGPLMRDTIYLCQHKSDQNLYDDIQQLPRDIKIALTRGYPEQDFLSNMGFNQLRLTNSPFSTMNMLLKKRVPLISCSPKAMWDLLVQNATPTDEVQVTNIALYQIDLYIAFHHQTSATTIKRWQQALEQAKTSSEYIELNHAL